MVHEIECYRNFLELAAVLIDRRYTYPDGTQVERTYTNRSQLNQIKYNSAVIDTRTYDIGGRLSTSTYSNGAVTTWNYRISGANKDNLLANIATTNPGANKVGTYTYTWDANRNKTAETISNSPLSGFGFSTGTNGYDNENRVTAWNRSDSNQNQTWNLSLVGNWNTFNQTGTGPFNQTRTHGLAHEFTSFTGTSSGTLAYDTKGNLISRPATLAAPALNLTWDFDNCLSGADTDGTPATNEVTLQYDALGRRVARTESGITTVYVQAGQQTFADYASGAAPSSPTYRYVYGDYIDEPVMRETASGSIKHFYHRNQQYSITALTDNNGNTAERYAYTANGVLTIFNATGTQISISALSNRYTYTGREWDVATALYHFRARTYDPGAGRFINRDPLGYIDGMSLYRGYFGLRGTDPLGWTNWASSVFGGILNQKDSRGLPMQRGFGASKLIHSEALETACCKGKVNIREWEAVLGLRVKYPSKSPIRRMTWAGLDIPFVHFQYLADGQSLTKDPKCCICDCHWLQFIRVHNPSGYTAGTIPAVKTQEDDVTGLVLLKFPIDKWVLDNLVGTSAWYDTGGLAAITNKEVSMFDAPAIAEWILHRYISSSSKISFKSYLVCNGEPAYEIYWNRTCIVDPITGFQPVTCKYEYEKYGRISGGVIPGVNLSPTGELLQGTDAGGNPVSTPIPTELKPIKTLQPRYIDN